MLRSHSCKEEVIEIILWESLNYLVDFYSLFSEMSFKLNQTDWFFFPRFAAWNVYLAPSGSHVEWIVFVT